MGTTGEDSCRPVCLCDLPSCRPVCLCDLPSCRPVCLCGLPSCRPVCLCDLPSCRPVCLCDLPSYRPVCLCDRRTTRRRLGKTVADQSVFVIGARREDAEDWREKTKQTKNWATPGVGNGLSGRRHWTANSLRQKQTKKVCMRWTWLATGC